MGFFRKEALEEEVGCYTEKAINKQQEAEQSSRRLTFKFVEDRESDQALDNV